ncbi:trehalose 6-phosphate phosphorylase [Streptomyces pluripotens]|uniref:Trehalose 6-phosphate phosphorylase n=1 Tax=Streptomyces pluripotens TaxID=1355015 RepID=A0A221NSE3_9ACTN|nr:MULTISPECIES: glycosyl hydrolase family 65 protein [Streptomyces]ARP68639.1 trehalose 6-phosphate phosphorylase [Streptomyces pluripotens]ASN22899.1 trehalose 6-phosphate phosphorylase [Streptomyces pluripotens]KIE26725.1 trehalose 6-phosphate phosphorylase [Streptomyces sp. MUSC 125]MCH0559271.1 glycoside hydrolase family 65 protein [Streptomyces sp. MUM 16J]
MNTAGPAGKSTAATPWTWQYDGYQPEGERLRESLCTLGNGYVATRGALPECAADDAHYPGTYVAGCYNRLTSHVAGRFVENEDMVNLPNWLVLRFRPVDGPWLTPRTATVLGHGHVLHLETGVLERRTRYRLADGRALSVRQVRIVHMADPHLAVLRTEVTAEDAAMVLDIEAALDGGVANQGVRRYGDLENHHLTDVHTGAVPADTVWLRCRTRTSDIRVGMAGRLTADADLTLRYRDEGVRAVQEGRLELSPRRTVTIDKTIALHTSRDPAISDPLRAALDRVGTAPGFSELLRTHRTAWGQMWRRADIDVPGEPGRILRLHLFHVLQTLSPHTAELDVGVPARGLHGEAYRGHIFWDELFVLRYLDLHFPEVSRALLEYRHRRLERACAAARTIGRRGALYPWQSGSDGREETQTLHLNPRSGRWLPDNSQLQRHVGSAIAYNVWQYCEASGDTGFLHTKGAEMLLQIARFWADSATYDERLDRYRIRGVMGPDEYHDSYPGAAEPGLDDNAYTNVTAAWVLARAREVLRALPEPRHLELAERTGLDGTELAHWEEVSHRMYVPFHDGVISQFNGYGDLAELDWDGYRERYADIRRLDRILEAEGDTVNRYKASKQADVLMLGYLFSPSELRSLFGQLGYRLDEGIWSRTVDYYLARTSHGSTLSGLVHGWVLARARRAGAWVFCQEALRGDIADLQGGTTGEGIHLGAMAGTLDLVQRGLPGLETRSGALWLDPVPVPELSSYGFVIRYQGHWGVRLRLRHKRMEITVPPSDRQPIDVQLADRSVRVQPGETVRLTLAQ